MPYELQFKKKLDYKSEDFYWNECCYGGEIIVDELLPILKERFNVIQSGCSGQVILAADLEEFQKSSSALFGVIPPLC